MTFGDELCGAGVPRLGVQPVQSAKGVGETCICGLCLYSIGHTKVIHIHTDLCLYSMDHARVTRTRTDLCLRSMDHARVTHIQTEKGQRG